VFPRLSEEEVQFKFDVVGGNPRKFYGAFQADVARPFYDVVSGALHWMFGAAYMPSAEDGEHTKKQKLGQWAIDLVVEALGSARCSARGSYARQLCYTLFTEHTVGDGCYLHREQFASVFLGLVAGRLQDTCKNGDREWIRALFSFRLRNAMEYSSHITLDSMDAYHICWSSTGEYVHMPLGNKRKVLIRTMADVAQLQEGERGVPTMCDLLFVDEIIAPNIGVTFTTSNTLDRFPFLSAQPTLEALGLEADAAAFTVVFVVPRAVLPKFVFPTNLSKIQMCVTVAEAITDAAFKKLCKKRKRS
jgi:hypothetical protein